jgi:putative lipoic acid-binding regulatory protein
MAEEDSLIKYPCSFPIKVMGKSQENFVTTICTIVQNHAPDFNHTTVEIKHSTKGGYLSVTCTIVATSRIQLDALYQELFDHPMVTMVL